MTSMKYSDSRKKRTARKHSAGRSTAAGTVMVPVPKKDLKIFMERQIDVGPLLGKFSTALKKFRNLDRPLRFVVEMMPHREMKIVHVLPENADSRSGRLTHADPALEDALERARERGHARVADILNSPDMLSPEAFADLLGVSRMTVYTKQKNHQVLGLEGAKRGLRFPEWQIADNGKPFPALPDLFDRLGNDSWAVYRFLVQSHPELDGMTGREALEQGKIKQAVEAAESVARDFS